MSTDISRVYAFLAKQGDWVNEADKNGDGAVIKSEFRDFMEENFEWNGEESTDSAKNDLINSFWKTIDTNQSGKVSGTKLKNKNALDKKELAAMNDKIEMYEILNNFVDQIEAPDVVYDSYAWKKSLSESLGNFVENYIKQGGKPDGLESKLNEELPAAKARTTADYVAQEYIEEVLSDVENYARGDDKTLSGIIDKYIAEIKKLGNDNLPTDEEIQTKVKSLVDAYLSTANIGNGDASTLATYGYAPKDKSIMNDLQKAVLLTNALTTVKYDAKEKASYDLNSEGYTEALNNFINSLKYGDFDKYQNNILEEFKNSSYYATVQEKVDAANLEKTRNEAIEYCDSIYKQGGVFKTAVEDIFGSNYAQNIKEMDASSIKSSLAQLKEIVGSYDISGMTEAEKKALFSGVKDSYEVNVGKSETFSLSNSATCNGNIITSDRITYQSSGCISIDASGKATINPTAAGVYSSVVTVSIDGKKVATKTITINAALVADLRNDDKTVVNGETIKNIMLTNNNIIGASDWVRPSSALSSGLTFITSTLDSLQTTLISGGYDSTKTKKAIDILKEYYVQILNAVNNKYRTFKEKDYGDKGITSTNQGSFTYQGANGKTNSLKLDANWKEYKNAYDFTPNEITCSSGFGISHQRKGSDNYKFFFNTKSLLNLFKTVYDSI